MTTERPEASSESVRRRLSSQAVRDTKPELVVRRALHQRGLRYRVNYPVPGMPRRTIDIAFPRRQLAVFVDGCFWHACPAHSVTSKSNTRWWQEKLEGNVKRDVETSEWLAQRGWAVMRFWEHDLRTPEGIERSASYVVWATAMEPGSNSLSISANSCESRDDRSR